MEGTCKTLNYEEILELNRLVIENYGGLFIPEVNNVANENSLRHLVETLDETIFGQERYPGLFHKAAILGWNIIAKHLFRDGNKRTGIFVCYVFLAMNNYSLGIEDFVLDTDVIATALAIATNKMTVEDFAIWLENKSSKFTEEDIINFLSQAVEPIIKEINTQPKTQKKKRRKIKEA